MYSSFLCSERKNDVVVKQISYTYNKSFNKSHKMIIPTDPQYMHNLD